MSSRPNPFQFQDYRDFIRQSLEHDKERKGLITKMAAVCKCERSHISRVLHGHIHLTMDQAYGMCEFWQLADEEATLFLRLVELARAGNNHYRRKLEREIARLRQAHENISKRLKFSKLEREEFQPTYYSSWYWSAIHIIVSIAEFQSVERIAEKLHLSEELVAKCLHTLKEFGMVAFEHNRWKFNSEAIHLGKDSPFRSLMLGHWRQQAIQHSQLPQAEGLHYSTVQSLSHKDFASLKESFLRTIDQYQAVASPSAEEELTCFNIDFFKVGGS